jgi:ribosomal protein L5
MAETKKTHTDRKAMRAFVEKVVIDAGVGRLSQQPSFEEKILPQVMRDIAAVAGQTPQVRKAKESIAGFKVREGTIVGLRVTLRREKAVDFFERLITIVLPRVRDFGGLEHSAIDQGGTLNVGVRDHLVFPEIVAGEIAGIVLDRRERGAQSAQSRKVRGEICGVRRANEEGRPGAEG